MSVDRCLSPQAVRTGSVAGMLGQHVASEVRQNLRIPEYLVGVVAIPVLLYTMFGVPQAGQDLPAGTDVGAVMFGSLACYGVVSLAIFTFGVDIAQERGRGWLRRLRATPMPTWVYFAGKGVAALLFTAAILAAMLAVATGAGVSFAPDRLALTVLLLLAGALAFAPAGLALAFWVRPRAASAIGNLVFLPLSFASGFFFPLEVLPRIVQEMSAVLPTYHFGQLVWAGLAPAADRAAFGISTGGSTLEHLAWVVVSSLVFTILAVVGYRRDSEDRRW